MFSFSIIVAMDSEQGIGKNGQLPWHLSGDLKHFKDITIQTSSADKRNVVIMGRKTWESIPLNFQPLSRRINIVLTRNPFLKFPMDVFTSENFSAAFDLLDKGFLRKQWEKIFVIGGGEIFREALKFKMCDKIYATHICRPFGCDTFFPLFLDHFALTNATRHQQEHSLNFYFAEYRRRDIAKNDNKLI